MDDALLRSRLLRVAAAALGLLLFGPAEGATRTFKVLDTTTGAPVPGAEAWLMARGTFPAPGHPGEFTLGEWTLRSDQNGEIHLSSIWADKAWVVSVRAPGYGKGDTVVEYIYRRSANANQDVLFLTPAADLAHEQVQYLFHLTEIAVTTDQGLAGGRPMSTLTVLYPQARRVAKLPRELAALRQFCRFVPQMEAVKAAGWAELGSLPESRAAGQRFIDDCAAEPGR